jgi:hypothetical protein
LRVTVIGILSFLAGTIYMFPVLGIYDLGNLINMTGSTFDSGPFILTAFVFAIANIVLGVGCLYGWSPIWIYFFIIAALNFMVALITMINIDLNEIMTVLIAFFWLGLAIYYLYVVFSKQTRVWFSN